MSNISMKMQSQNDRVCLDFNSLVLYLNRVLFYAFYSSQVSIFPLCTMPPMAGSNACCFGRRKCVPFCIPRFWSTVVNSFLFCLRALQARFHGSGSNAGRTSSPFLHIRPLHLESRESRVHESRAAVLTPPHKHRPSAIPHYRPLARAALPR
ncbi:hypothetical protein DFH07DRAFT_94166 [Mycena maculata]|uniref:Uncharacterized protein n=1 Tax=Mycena maculata TaxID=230809 RepID=A0AAD7MXR2_9AGAR|nr:hypothetical protein DFH07DRAFT_94166 [Mycena maculata]